MLKKIFLLFAVSVVLISLSCTSKKQNNIALSTDLNIEIICHSEDELLLWASRELADDIASILGTAPAVHKAASNTEENSYKIVIQNLSEPGTGSSHKGQERITGKHEHFQIRETDNTLLITGSDIRGTVYGVFHLSEMMGISPWKWWADVHPQKSESIHIQLPENGIEQGPSVKYRGIFLNDEDWGLQPWAAQTVEPETGDIGPKTYEKIFRLLLRLKANTIWPAMHHCTKAFFSIPGNAEMAAKYHIVLGTSHAEPMLRNNVDEWNRDKYGDFNYFENSENVQKYWQERITELKETDNEFMVTLGMRGIHDSGMRGSKDKNEQARMLETILIDQRAMLENTLGKSADQIPQTLIPYKEVLELYKTGMQVPDDISLMWTDDNYGYIRRHNSAAENQRSGGGGVYYHISYWGRPHDYLWLSTTQPSLIWYEMQRAYANGADNTWILNVGDIKPAEYNMELFLDMAWNIQSVNYNNINKHLHDWAKREFGSKHAETLSEIMQEYYRLAFIRKPEFMAWSQTEPTRPVQRTELSTDESEKRMLAYQTLSEKVKQLKSEIPEYKQDAFFQLIEYPVLGAANMNIKYLQLEKAYLTEGSAQQANLEKAQHAHKTIAALTEKYNNEIAGGKWKGIIDFQPRRLPVFQFPEPDTALFGPAVNSGPSEKTIFMNAADYDSKTESDDTEWCKVEGLGYSGGAMTVFPLTEKYFNQNKPSLNYSFQIDEPGPYTVQIRCLPTHSNNFDHILSVKIDDSEPQDFKLNTKGRSSEWKENVLRNSQQVNYTFTVNEAGAFNLTLSVNQTGIVLDQIAVFPEGKGDFYMIPRN